MGILGYLVSKGVQRASIKTVGRTVAHVMTAKTVAETERINAETQRINAEVERAKYRQAASNRITKDSAVVDETVRIKPPRSSEKYHDRDAFEAAKELFAAGFVDVTLRPVKSLSANSNKYGKIRSISINGNSDFMGVRKVSANSKIIITYSDFKKDVNKEAFTNARQVASETTEPATDTAITENAVEIGTTTVQQNNTAEYSFRKYCVYCGEPITNERARFCSACGEKI